MDSSVSCCAPCSWRPADKLVLMATGHKATLTASPGCLSLRGSSAFPRFYGLKLSGEGGKAVMGSFFSLIQWPHRAFRKYQHLETLRRKTEEREPAPDKLLGLKSVIANDNSIRKSLFFSSCLTVCFLLTFPLSRPCISCLLWPLIITNPSEGFGGSGSCRVRWAGLGCKELVPGLLLVQVHLGCVDPAFI